MFRTIQARALSSLVGVASIVDLSAAAHAESAGHDSHGGVYELILTTAYAHSFTHEQGLPASELHFTYWVTPMWGAGAAYVAKFDDEVQHEIPILLSANPTSWLTLNVGPNLVLPFGGGEFSVGAYAEAELNLRPTPWFHFGPVVGTVIGEANEVTIGFHLGFEK